MAWFKKMLKKNHLPKSFLFATKDDARRNYFNIQSFDLNLWHENEKEIHVDIGLRIEFFDIAKFLDSDTPYSIKILTPFIIKDSINDYFDSLKNPDFAQLLFNASYKETADISLSVNDNENADAKVIKFLSEEDNFILIPYTINVANNNEITLEFSGKKYIDSTKLNNHLSQTPVPETNVTFEFQHSQKDDKDLISISNSDIEAIKNTFLKSQKNTAKKCCLYFRFSYTSIKKASTNIEELPSLFSKQVFFDIRVNERRQNTVHSFTVDKADLIRVNQLRSFIILPNYYQLSTPATSKTTRYIRTLEKSEWEKNFDFIKKIKETLFVYYWKYTFENPSNASYSMIASFNAKHKSRIELIYYISIIALYFGVFYLTTLIIKLFTESVDHLIIHFISTLLWVGVLKLYNKITKVELE